MTPWVPWLAPPSDLPPRAAMLAQIEMPAPAPALAPASAERRTEVQVHSVEGEEFSMAVLAMFLAGCAGSGALLGAIAVAALHAAGHEDVSLGKGAAVGATLGAGAFAVAVAAAALGSRPQPPSPDPGPDPGTDG